MATHSLSLIKLEGNNNNLREIEKALRREDYPYVFELAKDILGIERLIQDLNDKLKPKGESNIYDHISRWPIPIYLTTNYDDEIQNHLTKLNEPYTIYSNSRDHFAHLLPNLKGAIFKLHGDLRSEEGLVLTTTQYKNIQSSETWNYWRTKLTSIFQLCKVVIIGHSLKDPNLCHVLEAAKKGTGVIQPICWIAPNATPEERREFLEKYRIRVISYDNSDKTHNNLLRLVENISDFIPPRESIRINSSIKELFESPLENNAAAPAFYVFNKLLSFTNLNEKRIDIILAALESSAEKLKSLTEFTLKEALTYAGWPRGYPIDRELLKAIEKRAIKDKLFVKSGDKLILTEKWFEGSNFNRQNFINLRNRFLDSLRIRIKRNYPNLPEVDVSTIINDIESSLSGYFRVGGLTLASILFSSGTQTAKITVPKSIIKFISESSACYDDLLKRQAFTTSSVDIFVRPSSAERSYLGRMSHGFFAFNVLGVYGDLAEERLKHAKDTVWLVDSNSQIPSLSIGAHTHTAFKGCFSGLNRLGIRFCTTEKLFDETREHFWFADKLMKNEGERSFNIIAAATGQSPYYKPNKFLEGFVRWRSAGNPNDWKQYLNLIFNTTLPTEDDMKTSLREMGIETIDFQNWPGFCDDHFADCETYISKIVSKYNSSEKQNGKTDTFKTDINQNKKAKPEGEALMIINRERAGEYYLLSEPGTESPAWFISSTSILNRVEPGSTWRPEAFLRYASTLSLPSEDIMESQSFETILLNIAQSGKNLLDEQVIEEVFCGVIDQANISIKEQLNIYNESLSNKYGDLTPEKILDNTKPSNRPFIALQLASEIASIEAEMRKNAEKSVKQEKKRADKAENELKKVQRYRRKLEEKKAKAKKLQKKQRRKKRKKRKKNKKGN